MSSLELVRLDLKPVLGVLRPDSLKPETTRFLWTAKDLAAPVADYFQKNSSYVNKLSLAPGDIFQINISGQQQNVQLKEVWLGNRANEASHVLVIDRPVEPGKPALLTGPFSFSATLPAELDLDNLRADINSIVATGGCRHEQRTITPNIFSQYPWESAIPSLFFMLYQSLADPRTGHMPQDSAEAYDLLNSLIFSVAYNLSGLNRDQASGKFIWEEALPFTKNDDLRIEKNVPKIKHCFKYDPDLQEAVRAYMEALADVFDAIRTYGYRISSAKLTRLAKNDTAEDTDAQVIWGVGDEAGGMQYFLGIWDVLFNVESFTSEFLWRAEVSQIINSNFHLGQAFRLTAKGKTEWAVSFYNHYLAGTGPADNVFGQDKKISFTPVYLERRRNVLWELAALAIQGTDLENNVRQVKSGLGLDNVEFWRFGTEILYTANEGVATISETPEESGEPPE